MNVNVSEVFRRPSSIYTPLMVVVEFDRTPQHTAEQEIRAAFQGVAHVSVFCNSPIRGKGRNPSVFDPSVVGDFEVWQLNIDETAPDFVATRETINVIAQGIATKG